jgi:hypothetical protein
MDQVSLQEGQLGLGGLLVAAHDTEGLTPGQGDEGGGGGADQQGQADGSIDVVGAGERPVAEGRPVLDPIAVVVAAA